jgi:subtilisin-like proprotein convertase family protein
MAQFIPTDTLFGLQWYLRNTGQTGSGPGNLDLDITSVWPDYTGKGVKVAVYDNGVDFNHVDLNDNYDHSLDAIIDGSPVDAHPLTPAQVGGATGFNSLNAHGTTLAGVIAAENNGVGTVGVAFDSRIVGVYAPVTGVGPGAPSSQTIQAMQQLQNYDVADFAAGGSQFRDGQGNPNLASFYAAIQSAATDGRGGLGTILVNAMHNSGPGFGGLDGNGSGFDANRFYIHVGGVLDTGDVVQYATRGANMLVSAFTGPPVAPGSNNPRNIETTDISGSDGITAGDYADSNGTSMSSPQVAGVAALMLQANPGLGWRDVQNILSQAARHTGSDIGGALHPSETDAWEFNHANNWNGGGRHYSIDYGYGIVDAHDAVRLAETWGITGTPAATSANQATPSATINSGSLAIPDNTGSSVTLHFNVTNNIRVEDVRLNLGVTHSRIQDLTITLISPDGTTSKVFNPVSSEAGTGNSVTSWAFLSEEFRGELSAGDWQAVITDHVSGNTGTLGQSTLQVFGASNITNARYIYTNEFHTYASLPGRNTLTDTDGGNDTINAAPVTSASHIDLNAGATSTIDGRSVTITAGSQIENAIGGDGNDALIGNSLDNILAGGRGTNTLDGGSGDDTAVFLQSHDKYTIQRVGSTIVVTGAESSDTLSNIEHLQFADITLAANNLFAPQITSNGGGDTAAISTPENSAAVTTVAATDQDPGSTITFSIVGGADQSQFQINAATGTLTFIATPDFEHPADADHNNAYLVTVRASDGTLSDDQAITVNVTDVNEAVTIARPVDFNADGVDDLLWRGADAGVSLWTSTGGRIVAPTGPLGFAPVSTIIEGTGDFNGDGRGDILFRSADSHIAEWLINGNQLIAARDIGTINSTWHVAGTGDFNGDHTDDILFRNDAGQVATWAMQGGSLALIQTAGSAGATSHIQGTGDFNGDGQTDVLFRNNDGHVITWLMNNGQASAIVDIGSAPATAHIAGTGDFNGDGQTDILFRADNGHVIEWLMTSGHVTSIQDIGSANASWNIVGTGDLNGDGRDDILLSNGDGHVTVAWLLDNAGQLASTQDIGHTPAGTQIGGSHFDLV